MSKTHTHNHHHLPPCGMERCLHLGAYKKGTYVIKFIIFIKRFHANWVSDSNRASGSV